MWLDSPSFTAVLLNTETDEQLQEEVTNPWEPDDLPDGFLTRNSNGRFLLTN